MKIKIHNSLIIDKKQIGILNIYFYETSYKKQKSIKVFPLQRTKKDGKIWFKRKFNTITFIIPLNEKKSIKVLADYYDKSKNIIPLFSSNLSRIKQPS